MPDYQITVYMKVGPPKQGIRWFPSYDLERVKCQVHKKIKDAFSTYIIDRIEVCMIAENGLSELGLKED